MFIYEVSLGPLKSRLTHLLEWKKKKLFEYIFFLYRVCVTKLN